TAAPGSPDTDIVALRPGGGLGLTAKAHARSEANWLGKERSLNPGCEAISTFTGMTRRHRGGSDGLRAGLLAGLARFNFRVARDLGANRKEPQEWLVNARRQGRSNLAERRFPDFIGGRVI